MVLVLKALQVRRGGVGRTGSQFSGIVAGMGGAQAIGDSRTPPMKGTLANQPGPSTWALEARALCQRSWGPGRQAQPLAHLALLPAYTRLLLPASSWGFI